MDAIAGQTQTPRRTRVPRAHPQKHSPIPCWHVWLTQPLLSITRDDLHPSHSSAHPREEEGEVDARLDLSAQLELQAELRSQDGGASLLHVFSMCDVEASEPPAAHCTTNLAKQRSTNRTPRRTACGRVLR